MLKKPFSAPIITEFGRFEEIVLHPCDKEGFVYKDTPDTHVGETMGCDSPTDNITSPKNQPFCDAWHPCGSS